MGKRSGVPHTIAELERLNDEDILEEIVRAKQRLGISNSATQTKAWKKRIHWLEAELARRD